MGCQSSPEAVKKSQLFIIFFLLLPRVFIIKKCHPFDFNLLCSLLKLEFSCCISFPVTDGKLVVITCAYFTRLTSVLPEPELVLQTINLRWISAVDVQVSPQGFPSDLTSHPSSNSKSVKRRDLSFRLPVSPPPFFASFLRSEAEL